MGGGKMGLMDFTKGSVSISTEKDRYVLGEKVTATVRLNVNTQFEARGFKARLNAFRMVTRSHGMGRSRRSHTEKEILFTDEAELEKPGMLKESAEYNVNFNIPKNPDLVSKPGFLGFIGGIKIEWDVEAKVDIEGGLDINASKKLNVTE
jgi:hypothetical protein